MSCSVRRGRACFTGNLKIELALRLRGVIARSYQAAVCATAASRSRSTPCELLRTRPCTPARRRRRHLRRNAHAPNGVDELGVPVSLSAHLEWLPPEGSSSGSSALPDDRPGEALGCHAPTNVLARSPPRDRRAHASARVQPARSGTVRRSGATNHARLVRRGPTHVFHGKQPAEAVALDLRSNSGDRSQRAGRSVRRG